MCSLTAHAENLVDVYQDAVRSDPLLREAEARKMAARMEQQGHGFYYFENIEGGHAGTANKTEDSYRSALMMVYLNRELKGVGK